jgi:hypothetical protein
VSSLYFENFDSPPVQETYSEVVNRIKKDRNLLKRNSVSLDSCRSYFLDQFEHYVYPKWIGTAWDYNGYTNTPGKDKLIACGYFVSTPLKHMGFNWNRYKLAQMYSKNIVDTICDDMTKYTNKYQMINEIKKRKDNLYIVGLDSHVGMILKSGKSVWFVHSNYYGLKGPDKEIAALSPALESSDSYYLGTFLTDQNLRKWLDNTLFPTE